MFNKFKKTRIDQILVLLTNILECNVTADCPQELFFKLLIKKIVRTMQNSEKIYIFFWTNFGFVLIEFGLLVLTLD